MRLANILRFLGALNKKGRLASKNQNKCLPKKYTIASRRQESLNVSPPSRW